MSDNWSLVGWQGVSLRTPPDWNLVGVSGDETKGYFRIDSTASSSVEVRWTALKQPPADLTARANEFLDAIAKTARKRRVSFSSKVKPRKPTPAEEKHGGSSVGFTWKGDRNAYGRVLYCGYCKRLVVAQVVSDQGQDISGAATRILGSICEHEKPGWNVWALYDLAVPIPEGFRLQKHVLMSSFVELDFYSKKERLLVQRWGLAANQLLKKQTFPEWAERAYLPGVTGYRSRFELVDGKHETLEFSGVRVGLIRALLALPRALKGRPTPRRVSGCAWYCEESNKVYAIRHYNSGGEGLGTLLRNEIECH